MELTKDRIDRINKFYSGHALLLGEIHSEIKLTDQGDYEPTDDEMIKTIIARDDLLRTTKTNDIHAMISDEDYQALLANGNFSEFGYKNIEFACVRAKRAMENPPALLSSNGLIINPNEQIVFIQKRSQNVDSYPSCYHTYGGAFTPKQNSVFSHSIDGTLKSCFSRELNEEASINTEIKNTRKIFCMELHSHFLQQVFLGVVYNDVRFSDNWEGVTNKFTFGEKPRENILVKELRNTINWVPTGHMHAMVWLAMGAPGALPKAFGGIRPEQVCDEIFNSCTPSFFPPFKS